MNNDEPSANSAAAPVSNEAERLRTARGIAISVIERLTDYGGRYALYVLPDGSSKTWPADGKRHAQFERKYPGAFVGVYDTSAKRDQIVDDILATLKKP